MEWRADLLQRAEPRVCAWDIECTKLPLQFPNAEYDQVGSLSRHTGTQTRRHTATQPHRHTDTQAHSHTGTQPHRHTATQAHRHTGTQAHRHTGTQPRHVPTHR